MIGSLKLLKIVGDMRATESSCRATDAEICKLSQKCSDVEEQAKSEVKKKLEVDHVYLNVDKACRALSDAIQSLEKSYVDWRLNRDEDWECTYDDPEQKEKITPSIDILKALYRQLETILHKQYSTAYNEICEHLQLPEYRQSLLNSKDEKSKLNDRLSNLWNQLCKECPYIEELTNTYPNADYNFEIQEKEEIVIKVELLEFVTKRLDVDADEFKEPSDVANDFAHSVSDQIDKLIEKFENYCNTIGLTAILVSTSDVEDIDVDGSIYHHKRYYEEDTGYGEPEGDFCEGPQNCLGSVTLTFIVK